MPGLRHGALSDRKAIVLTSRQIALTMASAALGAKAEDVVVLDLRKISFSFDFFVLLSGSSAPRIQTIAEDIQEELAAKGAHPWHCEGTKEACWVLLDYGQVVGHVFDPEVRQFYDLEHLWRDAPRFKFPPKGRSRRFTPRPH